jgi:ubiquinone/menaquinone biosynthesis C-methylase UbiE
MLAKAKKVVENQSSVNVRFFHGTEEDIAAHIDVAFDAVIANFYFDLFTPLTLNRALNQIVKLMKRKSVLLVSDFVDTRVWWHRLLLFVMYRFFRAVCNIESSRLPDWQGHLTNAGFKELGTKSYYGGFIVSSIYFLGEN